MFPKKRKRSTVPIVRRTAGQSLREEWDRVVNDDLPFVVFVPLMFWLIWLTQCLEVWRKAPPQPEFWLALSIIITGAAAIAYLRLLPKARNLVRGERGELRVAEVLEDLRAAGYRVYHDLTRDGYNIDHVVVGPAGIFAIETKFRSGEGEITFRNGEQLFVGGVLEKNDSLKQARLNAAEVNRIIKENCSFDEWVWPIVVFVGDWRVKNDWQTTDARVFTTDRLVSHIVNRQPRLKQSEIKLIASHLERSVKS